LAVEAPTPQGEGPVAAPDSDVLELEPLAIPPLLPLDMPALAPLAAPEAFPVVVPGSAVLAFPPHRVAAMMNTTTALRHRGTRRLTINERRVSMAQ